MGKSKRKINEGMKIRDFRKRNNITNCGCCGVRLGNMCHHFLCNKCWDVKKNQPFEWKHYYKINHDKYYENNCKKWGESVKLPSSHYNISEHC